MHLLVETNFLVELILGQEQAIACEKIMNAAENGVITVHLPTFSLMEVVYKLQRLNEERNELQRQVQNQLGQAERETNEKSGIQQLKREFTTVLRERNAKQQERMLTIGQRIMTASQQIPVSEGIWQQAQHLQTTTELTLPDAIVGASILQRTQELGSAEQLFVTRDQKAFQQEEIRQLFERSGCRVLFNFEHACQRLRL